MKYYTHIPAGILLYTLLVWLLNEPFSIAGILLTAGISVLPDLIDKMTGEHRGIGHTIIWFIPIVAAIFLYAPLGIALLSGFTAHILFDLLTKKGVPFLYPFSKTALVMPKKEKSRIITGSKQEKALCLVVILILMPVSYGVINGMPDLPNFFGDTNKTWNNTTNKTNKTGNNLLDTISKKATGDLRSNSSYPATKTVYIPQTSTKTNTTEGTNDLEGIEDLGNITDLNGDTNTEDNSTNNNNTIDFLFDDLSNNEQATTDGAESDIKVEEDSSAYIPEGYDPAVNPDADYDPNAEESNEDGSGGDFFFLIGSLLGVGLLAKV